MSYGLYNNEFAQINHQYTWMNVAAAPAYPTLGLLCHLPLDSSLNDDSGNGNHCTAYNANHKLSYCTYKKRL